MTNEHPFQLLFETLGKPPTSHADAVNRQAYEILYDILSVPVAKAGRCILLRAPRAGHGKTHLLSRIQHHLGASHEFIPLYGTFGSKIDSQTVIEDTLRQLLRPLPASNGLCVLDLVTRRLFASALQPLVASGEVPCQDKDVALNALASRPIETFDFHHPNAVTALWARDNFEALGHRLSLELAQRCNLPIGEVAFWVDALFRFAATPIESSQRIRGLADALNSGGTSDHVMKERLEALLGMLTQLMRVVLVADDLEAFSSDESAALKLAAFLGTLRQSVERLDVILSLNQDIWQSAFLPRLSGGLVDRLSEVVVELKPLTEQEMVELLESRVPGLGAEVFTHVDREKAGTHARGLIQAAGMAWLRASAMDSRISEAISKVQEPAVELEAHPLPLPHSVQVAQAIETPEVSQKEEIAQEKIEEVFEKTPEPQVFEKPQEHSPFEIAPKPQHVFEAAREETPIFEIAREQPAFEQAPKAQSAFQIAQDVQHAAEKIREHSPFETVPRAQQVFQIAPEQPVFEKAREQHSPFEQVPSAQQVFQIAPEAQQVFERFSDQRPQFEQVPKAQQVFQIAQEAPSIFEKALEQPIGAESSALSSEAFPSAVEVDRVDDLLRQFRDRYGKNAP